jgi:hypothetical protein
VIYAFFVSVAAPPLIVSETVFVPEVLYVTACVPAPVVPAARLAPAPKSQLQEDAPEEASEKVTVSPTQTVVTSAEKFAVAPQGAFTTALVVALFVQPLPSVKV